MQKIGKYQVIEKIGVGGFGEVFKGYDPFIKRHVAIKTCTSQDPETRHRFFQEAEIAGNLHHRNITTVYDFGVQDELPYLIQEYLSGEDLHHKIKRRDFIPYPEKLHYLIQTARGQAYAHSKGIIHRDIKPANIRILEDGTAKIMDFGIAKLAQQETGLTKTGMTVGTAAYLAPEQIRGEAVTLETDIFSFGVMAYELLTYERPFQGEQISAVLYQTLNVEPKAIQTFWPAAPADIVAVIECCLRKNPGERFADGSQLLQALEEVQERGRLQRPSGQAPGGSVYDQTAPIAQDRTPSKGLPQTRSTPLVTVALDTRQHTATAFRSGVARPGVAPSRGHLDELELAATPTRPDAAALSALPSLTPGPVAVSRRPSGRSKWITLAAGMGLFVMGMLWILSSRGDSSRGNSAGTAGGAAAPPTTGASSVSTPSAAGGTAAGAGASVAPPPPATPPPAVAPPPPPPAKPQPAVIRFAKPGWTENMRVRFQGQSYPLPFKKSVEPGDYDAVFELELPDYAQRRSVKFKLAPGEERTLNPDIPAPGELEVRALPNRPQGRVKLAGQSLQSPIRNLRLAPGTYAITVEPLSGSSEAVTDQVEIKPGQRTIATFDLLSRKLTSVVKPLAAGGAG